MSSHYTCWLLAHHLWLLEKYKGTTNKHEVIGEIDNLDDVALLSDLWAADDCRRAIRTETLEMRKAQAILAVMQK